MKKYIKQYPMGSEFCKDTKIYLAGEELSNTFNPNLSWSHYRALMRVSMKRHEVFMSKKQRNVVGVRFSWNGRYRLCIMNAFLKIKEQIFASQYLKFLPTEKELQKEIEKERKLIEASMELVGIQD